jgi:hypothetical protein
LQPFLPSHFLPLGQPTVSKVIGGKGDDWASSMAVDAAGNTVVAGQGKSFGDTFSTNMMVVKMSPAGEILWAKEFGSKAGADWSKNYIDGETGGPSRTMAMGSDGAVYVGGGAAYAGNKEPAAASLFKLSPNGDLVWSKVWKPHWQNQMTGAAQITAVTFVGGNVYATGMTAGESQIFVAMFNAADGALKDLIAFDPAPTVNDRTFSIVADKKGANVWVGGWNGKTARGQLAKLNSDGKKLALTWVKEMPVSGRGSTICDLDLDASGNLYLAGDIHGASTWLELIKISGDGDFIWGKRYNAGGKYDRNNARIVRVIDNVVYLGGRVAYGDNTNADYFFGDSLLLSFGLDGALKNERYHFTGTQQAVLAMDHLTGIAKHGKGLVLTGWIYPYKMHVSGEWRNPNDYKFAHPIADIPAGEFATPAIANVTTTNLANVAPKNGSDVGLALADIKAAMTIGSPVEMSAVPGKTQFYFMRFDSLP